VRSQPQPQSEPSPSVPPQPQSEKPPQPDIAPIPNPGSQPIPQIGPSPPNITDPYKKIYDDVDLGLLVALIVVGLIWVLFGLRFMFIRPHITLLLAGFIILFFISYQLLYRFTVTPRYMEQWLAYTLAGIAGLIGAAVFFLSNKLGRFFFSAMSGVLFSTLLFTYTPLGTVDLAPEYKLAIIGGVGVLLGLVSIWLNILIPVIVSSFNGAFLLCNAIDNLAKFSPESNLLVNIMQAQTLNSTIEHNYYAFDLSNWHIYVVLGAIIVITVFGIILQYKITAATQIEDERIRKGKEANDSRDPETSPLLYN